MSDSSVRCQILHRLTLGVITMALASCGPSNDVSKPLRNTSECMLEVLKTVPGVKEPTLNLGVTNHQEWAYLDYMYPNQYGNDVNVRFSAHNQDKKSDVYTFFTDLPGIFPPEGPPPSDLGTDKIVPRWKSQCGAEVIVAID